MAMVEDPGNGLCQTISRVDDAGDVNPILNGKVLNVNVLGAHSGSTGVDCLDSGLVIFVDWGGCILRKSKFMKNRTTTFGNFGGFNGGEEFNFSASGGSDDGLSVASTGDDSTSKLETASSGQTTIAQVVGVGRVNEASKLEGGRAEGKQRKLRITIKNSKQDVRKSGVWRRTPAHDVPINSVPQAQGNTLQPLAVHLGRSSGELGKSGNSIADVDGASSNVGMQQLAKQCPMGETHLFG
jgi:hypothetical protein